VILDTYVAGLRELAMRKNLPFIDINAAYSKHPSDSGKPYSELLHQDGMHPNDKGHKLVFDHLIEELSRPISSLVRYRWQVLYGESNASGVKALGLLFCQQALCLSVKPR